MASQRNRTIQRSKADPRAPFGVQRYNVSMPHHPGHAPMHGTTVLCVRKDNKVVLFADGQVTMGDHVMKHNARKTRRLYNDKVIVGFAGSTADAISLFERFEGKLQEHSGNLQKAAVELAKEWRKDRALRHLEALLIVADLQRHIPALRQRRRHRARRRHLRHRLRRQLCDRRGACACQTCEAPRERPRDGSDAHRQRNLHLY